MSCEKCEKEPIVGAFYRWKTANIEIIACKEHWLEIREALNKAQSALDTKQEKCPTCNGCDNNNLTGHTD